jgi:hypothetical protein
LEGGRPGGAALPVDSARYAERERGERLHPLAVGRAALEASFTLNDAATDTETCTQVPIGTYTVLEGADRRGSPSRA